jgi:sulfur carrier protein ThiS
MRVDVRFRGSLADRLPGGRGSVDLPDGSRAGELLAAVGLPTMPCVFVVNGAAADGSRVLADGDRVDVHPPTAGG